MTDHDPVKYITRPIVILENWNKSCVGGSNSLEICMHVFFLCKKEGIRIESMRDLLVRSEIGSKA